MIGRGEVPSSVGRTIGHGGRFRASVGSMIGHGGVHVSVDDAFQGLQSEYEHWKGVYNMAKDDVDSARLRLKEEENEYAEIEAKIEELMIAKEIKWKKIEVSERDYEEKKN